MQDPIRKRLSVCRLWSQWRRGRCPLWSFTHAWRMRGSMASRQRHLPGMTTCKKILFFTNQYLSPLPLKLVLSLAVIGWELMAPVTMLKWCTMVSNMAICRYCIIVIIIIILCWLQLICEAYDLMKNVLGLSNDEMAKVFEEWNKGELDSFLIEISSQIMAYKVKREREGSRGDMP